MIRPELPPEKRKTSQLRIMLTAAEREELDRAADGNTSGWAREILLQVSRGKGGKKRPK